MKRRDFLKTSCSAMAALTCAPTLAETTPPQRHLKKAVMYATVRMKGTVAERFQAIRAAGYAGVEPMGAMNQQEVLEAFHANGLEAASVCCHSHWKETLTHQDPDTRKRGIEGVVQTLKDAKAYGAGSILVVPGVVNSQVAYDVAYRRSQEAFRELIPVAKDLQVRLSVENVWNNFLLSPLEMARFIDELDSPWVGSHFDIGNVLRTGFPEQWIHILGKRINRLHFKEFKVEKSNKEGAYAGFDVDFLEGSNNWKAIMSALDDIGYQGWCISEQGMGINPNDMKKLTAAMDKIFAM